MWIRIVLSTFASIAIYQLLQFEWIAETFFIPFVVIEKFLISKNNDSISSSMSVYRGVMIFVKCYTLFLAFHFALLVFFWLSISERHYLS